MTFEQAERAAEIIEHLKKIDDELMLWSIVSCIDSVSVRTPDGVHILGGHFMLETVKKSRIEILHKLKLEYSEELKAL